MGKVKEWKEKYPDRVTEYQFPMGKVKLNPDPECPPFKNLYQFPMGKVKLQDVLLSQSGSCINSLWER